MKNFITMKPQSRHKLCQEAGARLNLHDMAVEKDFWVCWTLEKLFRLPTWGEHLVFKGETSLSKCLRLIERFSEDIDIVIDRKALGIDGENAPESAPSRKQKAKRLDILLKASQECVKNAIGPAIKAAIASDMPEIDQWDVHEDPGDSDKQTLLFRYPTAFHSEAAYLRRLVKIEMGARADTEPTEIVEIVPYVCEVFPDLLPGSNFSARAVRPERTFWEKVMLLHEEGFRPATARRRKDFMARHYYDLYKLIQAGIGEEAARNLDLFSRIAQHREIFFRYSWMDYQTLKPGGLRLLPEGEQLAQWRNDYSNMRDEMIYGTVPEFGDILESVRIFQEKFNNSQSVI